MKMSGMNVKVDIRTTIGHDTFANDLNVKQHSNNHLTITVSVMLNVKLATLNCSTHRSDCDQLKQTITNCFAQV